MDSEMIIKNKALDALSAIYTGIFFIDLKKDVYIPVKTGEQVKKILQHISSAQEAITMAIRKTVQPEYMDKMFQFVNLKTLPERMQSQHCIDREYKGVISGWVRGSFIEVEREDSGELDQVLYTYQLIDEERKLEIEHQRRLELQHDIEIIQKEHSTPTPGLWRLRFDPQGELISCEWSSSFRKILGFTSKKELPDTFEAWAGRIHPFDKERVLHTFWQVARERTGEKIYDEEYRIQAKTGEYHWFRVCGRISRRPDKTVSSIDGFVVNMDEQHTTYEVLCKVVEEAEAARNRALLENEIISSVSRMYFAIFRIDLLHDFYEEVSSDTSIHILTGHSGKAQQKMNEICHALVSQEYRDTVMDFFNLSTVVERMSENDTIEMEYHAVDGNWHEARFIEKKRDENGQVTHILYVTRIVSKEKQRELERERFKIACKVAERASEAKSAFLFNMSHDIRTPMNAILGYEKLIRAGLTDPKLLHYQDRMEQASEILLSLINNVLDMARIESGRMELDETCHKVGNVISSVNQVFEVAAKEKGLEFEYHTEVCHSYIMCDITKVQEIFTNLISNAVKYTQPGGKISVITRELPYDREGYILIETVVEDTGIGMSREFLPHLFDEFSREKNTTSGKVAGTGLGMPIVKRLVELMSGKIEVESTLGKGSRFAVTIPHRLADKKYYQKEMDFPTQDRKPENLNGIHILLAEDNELNAEIAIAILEGMGAIIDLAADGIECVDKLQQSPEETYDLILMDIQMPNMDGYKATQVIRRLPEKKKAAIPIIAMTANAFEEDKRKALENGMNGHISKPVDVEKLEQTVARIVKNKKE